MTTTKLPDTQLVILSEAAQRPKSRVLPTPPTLKADAAAITRALKSLLKRGLLAEAPARKSDREWRRDTNGSPLTLVITPAGLAAIGAGGDAADAPGDEGVREALEQTRRGPKQRAASSKPSEITQRPGTKGAEITALLKRRGGATLAELTAASGWQAHSVRGFLSGTLKKKLGYTVASERGEDGVCRYRVAA
jgi:hypothetical protein